MIGEREVVVRGADRHDDERDLEPFEEHTFERQHERVPVEARGHRAAPRADELLDVALEDLRPRRAAGCSPRRAAAPCAATGARASAAGSRRRRGSVSSGSSVSAGPRSATTTASAAKATAMPSRTECQPRVNAAASTIVSASTISTAHARKVAATRITLRMGPKGYGTISRWPRTFSAPSSSRAASSRSPASTATGAARPAATTSACTRVCAVMTAEFLEFSRAHGNDLSTPMPEHGFAGLVARRPLVPVRVALAGGLRGGHGARGPVAATHARTLEWCSLAALRRTRPSSSARVPSERRSTNRGRPPGAPGRPARRPRIPGGRSRRETP